jgi:hypothetical protein
MQNTLGIKYRWGTGEEGEKKSHKHLCRDISDRKLFISAV